MQRTANNRRGIFWPKRPGGDEEAASRDLIAAERDEVASRDAFVSGQGDYGVALKARRSAALDRLDSKDDRTSSAQDRATLAEAAPSAL